MQGLDNRLINGEPQISTQKATRFELPDREMRDFSAQEASIQQDM